MQVIAIMADNASNNNTMYDELERLCDNEDIQFNAWWAHLCCMPHTSGSKYGLSY